MCSEEGLPGGGCRDCFIEVKSVTLVDDGTAMFPDAPLLGGQAHEGTCTSRQRGLQSRSLFVIQRIDVSSFIQPRHGSRFSDALVGALEAGLRYGRGGAK